MHSLTDARETPPKPRLLTQVRERIRFFIRFHGLRHPETMGRVEVEAFLTHLASERNVAASTHGQALSALRRWHGWMRCCFERKLSAFVAKRL